MISSKTSGVLVSLKVGDLCRSLILFRGIPHFCQQRLHQCPFPRYSLGVPSHFVLSPFQKDKLYGDEGQDDQLGKQSYYKHYLTPVEEILIGYSGKANLH